MSDQSATDRQPSRLADSLGARSGSILGHYELVRRIGAGGMAEVYEAVHRGLKKTVAIKVLLPDVADNEDLRARFLREGEAASRIQHPHVVDVTDVGEDGGIPYLVMELLQGETLTDVLQSHQRMSVSRTLDVLLPISAALSEAHRSGVVHRDLKPDNIFIARASGGKVVPKLLDFGVSKLTTAGIPSITSRSSVLGTPHYMAPEQALGTDVVGARADQYAFALVIYECVTGTLPFTSENVVALLHEVARGIKTPPSHYAPTLPPGLDGILLRALAASPAHRYDDLDALSAALLPFATPRAAEAYRALVERDSGEWGAGNDHRLAVETTGDFSRHSSQRPRLIDEGAATLQLATPTPIPTTMALGSLPTPSPVTAKRGTKRELGLVALGLALAAAAGLAIWASTPEGTPEQPDAPVAPVVASASPLSPPSEAQEPAAVSVAERAPSPTRIVVVAFPSDAALELDGHIAGYGSLDRELVLDGTPHSLVVRANGYQPETVTFTTEAPPARIELSRTRRQPSSMSSSADRTPQASPPRRTPDDDLRDSR